MFDPAQLAALTAVHRRGSFDLAAADLNVTPSAISQRIKALEEAAGTLLIRREKPCFATPTGARLVRHYEQIALLNQTLAQDLQSPAAPATLRIAVNADSLAAWVIPALAATEGYLYDVLIDDQDFSHDLLKRGEVAGAITAQPTPLQGCDSLPLGTLRYTATASPAYIARWFPDGVTPQALSRAPTLRFNDKDRLQSQWAATQGQRGSLPAHRLASSHGFVDACLSGLGWALNPATLIASHLQRGTLLPLIPGTPVEIPLYWQFTRLTARALAPLTRALVAEAGKL